MDTSLSNSQLTIEGRSRMERLSALSREQLFECLRWLVQYSPGAIEAALSAIDPLPSNDVEGMEPVCGVCGGDIGIFIRFGLEWRHYRDRRLGKSEIFDAGHEAQLTWRRPS